MKRILAALMVLALAVPLYAQSYGNGKTKTPNRSGSSSSSVQSPSQSQPKPAAKPSLSKAKDIGSKPVVSGSNSYDYAASRDRKQEMSQQKYEQAQAKRTAPPAPPPAPAPKPTYTDPTGKTQTVHPADAEVTRKYVDPDRYATRQERASSVFGSRYDRPGPVYSDRFDNRYYYWLRDRDEYTQARWAYNHRYEMDEARYNSFLANAAILAYITQMERDNIPRNPHYVPPGIDPDLQWHQGWVESTYNPQPTPAAASTPSSPSTPISFAWLGSCFMWLVYLALIAAAIYGIYWMAVNWNDRVKWWFFKRPDAETTVQNPLKIKLNQYVNLDTLDFKGSFHVDGISEWVRTLNGNTHRFTDYDLTKQADSISGEPEVKLRLRMNPTAKPVEFGMGQKILVLKLIKDEEYNDGLHNVLTEEPEKDKPDDPDFIIYDKDDQIESQWWRINDVRGVYDATVRVVVDRDGDGKADSELRTDRKQYWDFWRDRQNDDGVQEKEYLFIEEDAKTHWTQQWKGVEIDESEVS